MIIGLMTISLEFMLSEYQDFIRLLRVGLRDKAA